MSNDIQRLKALDLFLMYQDTLPEEDIQYAFDCLRSTNKKTITLAAFIISELDTSHLQRLFDHFHSYSQFTQHTLVSHLVTIPTKAPYLFLFNLLESSSNKTLVTHIITCLSKTDYLIFPLILANLSTENMQYLTRLKLLLSKIGFENLEVFLSSMPVISHENIFRELFGDNKINSVKF